MQKQIQAWRQQGTHMVKEANGQMDRFAAIVEQLMVRDPNVSIPAICALQQAGPIVIPVLLAGLQHPHTTVRRNCVDIIDHGGYGGDARCSEALLPLLHDRIPHIRRAVWHTLFCERCRDESKCEIGLSVELDQVALLIAIGVNDPNLKLRRQLVADLCQHMADPRVRPALEQILLEETDPEILAVVRTALKL
jgi:hypothetical protein